MKKPGWYWRDQKARVNWELGRLPASGVKSPCSWVIQTSADSSRGTNHTRRCCLISPVLTPNCSHESACKLRTPASRRRAAPHRCTSLAQETHKQAHPGVWFKVQGCPTLPGQRTPTHWAVNRGQLCHIFPETLISCHPECLQTAALWAGGYDPQGKVPNTLNTACAYNVIQGLLWIL